MNINCFSFFCLIFTFLNLVLNYLVFHVSSFIFQNQIFLNIEEFSIQNIGNVFFQILYSQFLFFHKLLNILGHIRK